MDTAQTQEAYILHRRRYRDTSVLLELLVREQGRIACVAKGALRNQRTGPVLQPFRALSVSLRGNGEVRTLSSAEPCAAPIELSGQRLYCGLYANELLMKMTARDDPHPALYDEYADTVIALAGSDPVEPLLRRFEMRLLDALGLGLALEHDTDGAPIEAERTYVYDVQAGAIKAASTRQQAISGETLLALRAGGFDQMASPREARALMRQVFDYHLEGRPLRSRELFRPAADNKGSKN